MREHFERNFELWPVLLIAVILLAQDQIGQFRSNGPNVDQTNFSISAPSIQVDTPRLIFR